ncbi:MAG: surface-adhesin E family protein [Hyphomonadaceae bacterium]
MRFFIPLLAAALALAACDDRPVFGGSATPAASATLPASCTDPAAVVTLRTTQAQPDWLLFAHQAGGGDIHFNQRSIRRCGDHEAEITVRVRFDEPQLYAVEETTRRTSIRYTVEHVRYRYRCAANTFTVLERQIIDENDRVAATIPGSAELYRPVQPQSTAGLIMRTACLGR